MCMAAKKTKKKASGARKSSRPARPASPKKKAERPLTHIALVLDCSGSMCVGRQETVDAFNAQVKRLEEFIKDQDITVTLITFSYAPNILFSKKAAGSVKLLSLSGYKPEGQTAMLDAISDAITELEAGAEKHACFLVNIITDGQENNSSRTTAPELGKRIAALEKTKRWTFTVMGASAQDLGALLKTLNIQAGNIQYQAMATGQQIGRGMRTNTGATANYLGGRMVGQTISTSFYTTTKGAKQ